MAAIVIFSYTARAPSENEVSIVMCSVIDIVCPQSTAKWSHGKSWSLRKTRDGGKGWRNVEMYGRRGWKRERERGREGEREREEGEI